MIWNDEILFIHAPKTGGMSLTKLLTENLPSAQATEARHETISVAKEKLGDLSRFKRIFVVMREPYTLEISRYNYLRIGHPVDRGVAQNLALAGDFKEYLRKAPFFAKFPPRLDLYYHDGLGRVPENMVILRYESLAQDIAAHVYPFLTAHAEIPRLNVTGESRFEDYYCDTEMERLCFIRHVWFFNEGFYTRRIPSFRRQSLPP
jgi:hypothetical protein